MLLLNLNFSLLLFFNYIFLINYVNCWKIHTVNVMSKLSKIKNNVKNNMNYFNNDIDRIMSIHKNTIIPVILSSCFIACQLSFPMITIAQSTTINNDNQKVYFGVGCFWVSVYQRTSSTSSSSSSSSSSLLLLLIITMFLEYLKSINLMIFSATLCNITMMALFSADV